MRIGRTVTPPLVIDASDEIVVVFRLVFVVTIDARIRHVVLATRDTGVVVGDSANLTVPGISCTRCSTPGHRADTCDVFGVIASATIKRRRNKRRERERDRDQPRSAS